MQARLFHHVCIHHQLAAHIDASASVCHCVHHWRRKTEESTIPALGGESHIKTTFKQCGIRKVLKILLSSSSPADVQISSSSDGSVKGKNCDTNHRTQKEDHYFG